MKFNTIIFDLDGPLLDGKMRHYQCYADILTELNYMPMPCDQYWDMKRNRINRREQLAFSSAETCYDEFLKRWLAKIEERYYLRLDRLQSNVITILENLKLANKQMILATMRKNKSHLFEQLANLGIIKLFDEIVAIDTDEPNASKSAYVKGILQNKPGPFLWIGDTEVDVTSAKELNIPIAVVSNGLRTAAYLRSLAPDYISEDLNEIITWMEKPQGIDAYARRRESNNARQEV